MVKDMTGRTVGLWRVLGRAQGSGAAARWRCRCTGCGTVAVHNVRGDALRGGSTLGCSACRAARPRAVVTPALVRVIAGLNAFGVPDCDIARMLGVGRTTVDRALEAPAATLRAAG